MIPITKTLFLGQSWIMAVSSAPSFLVTHRSHLPFKSPQATAPRHVCAHLLLQIEDEALSILFLGACFCFLLRTCMQIMLWSRETDTSATPTILPKPPFEARAVEEIMKLRRAGPGVADAHTTYSTTASASLSEDAAGVAVSIEDRLEGQQPNKIKAWLGFRVSWVRGYFVLCGLVPHSVLYVYFVFVLLCSRP